MFESGTHASDESVSSDDFEDLSVPLQAQQQLDSCLSRYLEFLVGDPGVVRMPCRAGHDGRFLDQTVDDLVGSRIDHDPKTGLSKTTLV